MKLRAGAHGGGKLQTGNPGNRGGGRQANEFLQACRDALDRLDAARIAESIATNPRKAPRDRLAALTWLADRGYGKPVQPLSGEGGGPIEGAITVRFVKPDARAK